VFMIVWAPLFAADVSWIKLVVPVIAFFIYIINHFIAESKNARKRPPRKPAATVANPSQRPAGQPVAADEIEEFLRRAAQQRKQPPKVKEPPPRPKPATRNQPPVRDTRTAAPKPAQRAPQPQPTSRRLTDQPGNVEIEAVNPSRPRESVAEHVAKRLSTEEFKVRASHLADEMTRADLEREQHLKKTFGHQVGKIGSQTPPATDDKVTSTAPVVFGPAAGGLGGLLHGNALRYAVVLNEILTRPEDRW
jgi:hypothetical protein